MPPPAAGSHARCPAAETALMCTLPCCWRHVGSGDSSVQSTQCCPLPFGTAIALSRFMASSCRSSAEPAVLSPAGQPGTQQCFVQQQHMLQTWDLGGTQRARATTTARAWERRRRREGEQVESASAAGMRNQWTANGPGNHLTQTQNVTGHTVHWTRRLLCSQRRPAEGSRAQEAVVSGGWAASGERRPVRVNDHSCGPASLMPAPRRPA